MKLPADYAKAKTYSTAGSGVSGTNHHRNGPPRIGLGAGEVEGGERRNQHHGDEANPEGDVLRHRWQPPVEERLQQSHDQPGRSAHGNRHGNPPSHRLALPLELVLVAGRSDQSWESHAMTLAADLVGALDSIALAREVGHGPRRVAGRCPPSSFRSGVLDSRLANDSRPDSRSAPPERSGLLLAPLQLVLHAVSLHVVEHSPA